MNRQPGTEFVLGISKEFKGRIGGRLASDMDVNPLPTRLYVEVSLALAVVLLLSIPSVKYLIGLPKRRLLAHNDGVYEDEDGRSSPEALSKFSTRVPKTLVAFFAVTGFFASTHLSILDTVRATHDSLVAAIWLYSVVWVRLVAATPLALLTNSYTVTDRPRLQCGLSSRLQRLDACV